MRTETIPDVPNDQVRRVRQTFETAGAKVTVTPNSDGKTSTVVAVFADVPDESQEIEESGDDEPY